MHAAESGHWYKRSGEPCYTVVGANGKERAATVRDARKLDLVPSVTGIIKCAAAPGLEHWKQEQMMLASLTLPRRPHETERSWIARVWDDSRAQAAAAAEKGTAIHAAIQQSYELAPSDPQWDEHVNGVRKLLAEQFNGAAWVAEQSFAHSLGFGGKTDLHDKESTNLGIVLDCKTKEFDDPDSLDTYDEHAMQLAAYRHGLDMPFAHSGIVYVSVTVPGLATLKMIDQDKLARGWKMFQSLLAYWQAKNRIEQANGAV